MIGDIRKFRFWCQKVLPLVYDDSLSYYEVLCKIVQYLNKVIEDVNSIPDYIDAVITERLSDEHLQELIEQFVLNIEAAISSNNEGDNTNSSADYNVGQMLWLNGKLYRVIRQIDAGDTFIVDTNIALVNFEDLFNDFIDEVKHDISANDDGTNTTATQSWTAGDWLWLNDALYIVKSDITQGNAYVFSGENANVEQTTVEDELKKEATARANADTALQTAIDDEATARANADTTLQTAIDDEATARANADDALQAEIDALILTQAVLAEDYGAKGDGVADDTTAIQTAINNAQIVILKNTYRITSSITLRDGVVIMGKGGIIVDGQFDAFVMDDNCSIIGLGFTDTLTNYVDDNVVIYANEKSNLTISDCSFSTIHIGYCVRLDKCEHLTIEHNNINVYSYAGIMLVNGCQHGNLQYNKIINGMSSNANRYPISFSGYFEIADRPARFIKCNYNEIQDSTSVWEGIDSHGCEDCEVIGNTISGTRYGIVFSNPSAPTLASGNSCKNVVIKNNIISVVASEGLVCGISLNSTDNHGRSDVQNIEIDNNRIVTSGTPSYTTSIISGIAFRTTVVGLSNIKVSNNEISGVTNGITFEGANASSVLVENNYLRSLRTAGTAAINFRDCLTNYVADNINIIGNMINNCALDFAGPTSALTGRGLIHYDKNIDVGNYTNIEYSTNPRTTAPSSTAKSCGVTGDFIPCSATGSIAGWLCNSTNHWVAVSGTAI